ncbi:MAG TPA: hypothetical protein VGL81_20555 [Polyangiaceae bacterium]
MLLVVTRDDEVRVRVFSPRLVHLSAPHSSNRVRLAGRRRSRRFEQERLPLFKMRRLVFKSRHPGDEMRLLEDEMAHPVETMCLLEDKMRHSVDKTTHSQVEASRRVSSSPERTP